MAETKTVQQSAREQFKVAEDAANTTWRAWADLAATSTAYAFDAVEQSLSYGINARADADKLTSETLHSYRNLYQQSLKNWQSYVQGVGEIFNRARQS
ncbi:hypothetical protein SE17_26855 [Kouleothrix aurantiaca]|uniref:Phasin domain-containing protein n=1 Tax=Kouleothrix aurantiaca TaxID=186479 RepID=A0A0P9F1Z0_9CHLR|nr:hypothetical protein SE17_26855 [Kouleothrix aurantiaca]